jgi:hypothetical protein
MAMKETIKKILKEETVGSSFTKFELHVLNWMHKELNGSQLDHTWTNSPYEYGKFLTRIKNMFGIGNKGVSELIYLYKHNWSANGFQQRDNVERETAHKFKVSYYRDVSAYVSQDFYLWATDDDSAHEMADAEDYTGEGLADEVEWGDVQVGDYGDVYDTEIVFLEQVIKKELNLLKEDIKSKMSDKLLITICKDIERILDDNGLNFDELNYGFPGGNEYSGILDHIIKTYGLPEDAAHYVIAVYSENYERINKDWRELLETGIDKPQKTRWKGRKEYGASQWITSSTTVDAYSEAEANYYDWDAGLDWEDDYIDTHDTWDEETEWEKY